ncbi:MAG: hypothetical protein Q8L97_01170 [Nitrosomonas sp.]|nr:hypothetical protein [Nitrosomonas sp.]MDP1548758.1 hypothetical protein [Nitrosomonas sp.]MDP1788360.1 hypothetical protein [Nitrosomonas sp.]
MPCLFQLYLMFTDNALDTRHLISRKTATTLQAYWIKPKFGNSVVSFNMDMNWFILVAGKKEETVRSNP